MLENQEFALKVLEETSTLIGSAKQLRDLSVMRGLSWI